ncbi:hypothetical protein CHLRE_07g330850v5 [Chlamydomonas reinhardtii]|uniref:Sugar phosphate transporter domain-containing protein n=1 Tax=Chlamydomonas reinhardtii TaxID=3055 RepID=A0A2K3DJV8_CHLRE|nr:uncharacterized protein CHLRE_07g330850v5 [Chlamydomonas reinhardtii]PNW80817.1 hypothetical protein CHLRE_07g330850v5 [Chlamydomonas reinhardtii]
MSRVLEALAGFGASLSTTSGRKSVKCLALILTWYVLSTGLSLYNKQLVGKEHGLFGRGAFPAPLFMSSVQFACQTLLAKLTFGAGLASRTMTRRLPWSEYFRMVVPNGITTGLDIGFSNKSLVFINLSFYTMCKSTVPVFLLFFAFVWGIEKPNWELMAVVLVIVSGLALLVRGETKFDMLGFGLVMTASCLSGLRFTLTQVLLHGHQSSAALGGPLEVLELLTPVMSVTVMIFSLAWEELWLVLPGSPYFETAERTLLTSLVIAAGALIAFLMVWAEYQVIKETSALTFMIAGTVKEVVTVLAAVVIMGDELTLVNSLGLVIVIVGVLLFNWYKYRRLQQPEEATYTVLESTGKEDGGAIAMDPAAVAARNGSSKYRRGGVPTATLSGAGAATLDLGVPVSAAAVAAGGGAGISLPVSGSGLGAGGGLQMTSSAPAAGLHNGAGGATGPAGLFGRALVSMGIGGGGGAGGGGATKVEMTPLLASTNGGNGGEPEGSGHGVGPSGGPGDPVIVGLGSSGAAPAAAVALSGGGMSGLHRGPARLTPGLAPGEGT